jgi:tetratricopeptide (TPR) repeat protein
MAKIAVCLIIKDDSEVDILKRALTSVKDHVDGIFITGTKKPQIKVKKLCKKFGAKWSWFSWVNDFSAARNFNFNQVPKEYDWIFWMDTDDIVVGADKFRDAVELAEKNNLKAIFARYLYQVEFDEKGNIKNILIEHLRERLIRNDGTFEWVAPIHETLIEKTPSGKTDYEGFYVVQITDPNKMQDSMYRNISILEDEVIRNPQDPRPLYYLAKAYFDTAEPMLLYESAGEGIDSITVELLKDYLRKSGWAEERAQAWEYLSMIHRERGEFKKAILALLEALSEEPKFPSIYIQLALCYTVLKDWSKALHWVKLAGNVETPKTTLVVNPRDYKTMILESLFHIYLNTGQLDLCFKVASELARLLPSELNATRLKDITDLQQRNNLAHWTVKLAYHLRETKQFTQLNNLIQSIPQEIANEPVLVNLKKEFSPVKTWNKDEIAIYCGPGFEKWSPKSVSKGIGGSEEAVIYLSKELAKLGWKVTVFADPQDDAGVYDGVNFVPYYDINWKDNFNIFISWRQIQLFDVPEFHAKKAYLWNHDIINPLTCTKERVDKIDKLIVLSEWHRQNIPLVPDEKILISSNGILI